MEALEQPLSESTNSEYATGFRLSLVVALLLSMCLVLILALQIFHMPSFRLSIVAFVGSNLDNVGSANIGSA